MKNDKEKEIYNITSKKCFFLKNVWIITIEHVFE